MFEKSEDDKKREMELKKKYEYDMSHCAFCKKEANQDYEIVSAKGKRIVGCSHCSAIVNDLLLQEARVKLDRVQE